MNKVIERLGNGLLKENPTFVLMLGMCPTLAVTTTVMNGIGMGIATTAVLVMSNLMISLLRNVIPDRVRMPAFIVIIATFVTIVEFLMHGYVPGLYVSLGIFIPLIVVNCIILGRAEAYASQNPVLLSIFDGIGMGLGFTLGLFCIAMFRELFGTGQLFGHQIMPSIYEPVGILVMAPGAFFVLAILTAIQNKFKINAGKKEGKSVGSMDFDCSSCGNTACMGHVQTKQVSVAEAEEEETE